MSNRRRQPNRRQPAGNARAVPTPTWRQKTIINATRSALELIEQTGLGRRPVTWNVLRRAVINSVRADVKRYATHTLFMYPNATTRRAGQPTPSEVDRALRHVLDRYEFEIKIKEPSDASANDE